MKQELMGQKGLGTWGYTRKWVREIASSDRFLGL